MTIGLSSTLRGDRLQLIKDAIDDGADEYDTGILTIYSNTRPSTGGTIDEYDDSDIYHDEYSECNIPLVEFSFPYPCGTIADGVLTFDTFVDAVAMNTGVASWARITDVLGNFVMDLSISVLTGSGDVKIDSLNIEAGYTVHCEVATITEGNP